MKDYGNSEDELLRLQSIRKEFPACLANDNVDLTIRCGEIHALLGENGAGKSTLVKIIYGVLHPDQGMMVFNGQEVKIANPAAARELGIGMVFQHFSLFEAMSVEENIALSLPKHLAGNDLSQRIRQVSEDYGLPIDPAREVWSLSVGERQRIEIVRCLLQSPQLLIMDEPTSVLTPQEAQKLFTTLRRLAADGVAILYISHRLEEIRQLCDQATIMRLGKVVAHCNPREKTARQLAELMMGSELATAKRQELSAQLAKTPATSSPLFEISDLSLPSPSLHGVALRSINLSLREGRILGIAGLAGNGQAELMDALSGERKLNQADNLRYQGNSIGNLPPDQRRKLGLSFVPEERLGHGAAPEMCLWKNTLITAASTKGLVNHGFINQGAAMNYAQEIIQDYRVKATSANQAAGSLSGGNLQKFIMGREILQSPKLLIILQPTWGVDAGSAAAIHQAILNLADGGAAVVVISQDLDEIFTLADDIAVMFEGQLSTPQPAANLSVEAIGLLMGGEGFQSSSAMPSSAA